MRVLLDTNIIITYLLHSQSTRQFQALFTAIRHQKVVLLLPEALLQELITVVHKKPYLAKRIDPATLSIFADALAEIAEEIPIITQAIPAVVRDKKDDYLIAYGLIGGADYLVTGDADLLVIGQIGSMHICTLIQLVELFE